MSFKKGTYIGQTKVVVTKSGEEILVRHGEGTYTYPNKFYKYQGQWSNGVKHGQGVLQLRDGTFYEGNWVKGEMEGHGQKKWTDGQIYTGDWHAGEMNGHGLLEFENGSKYEGQLERNQRCGEGELELNNNDVYNGQFVDDRMHGQGVYTWEDESEFKGNWANGLRSGEGTQVLSRGQTYSGNWLNDKPHGKGKLENESGVVFDGNWVNGKPENCPDQMVLRIQKEVEEANFGKTSKSIKSSKRPTSGKKGNKTGKKKVQDDGAPLDEEKHEVNGRPVTIVPAKDVFEPEFEQGEDGMIPLSLLPVGADGTIQPLYLCTAKDKRTVTNDSNRTYKLSLIVELQDEEGEAGDDEVAHKVGFFNEPPELDDDGDWVDFDGAPPNVHKELTRTTKNGLCCVDGLIFYPGNGNLETAILQIEDITPNLGGLYTDEPKQRTTDKNIAHKCEVTLAPMPTIQLRVDVTDLLYKLEKKMKDKKKKKKK